MNSVPLVTKKQYVGGEVKTADINNYKSFRRWYSRQNPGKVPLLGDNRKILYHIIGDSHWKVYGEHVYWVWVLKNWNETFILLTSKNGGTRIEVVLPVGNEEEIVRFAEAINDCLLDYYKHGY